MIKLDDYIVVNSLGFSNFFCQVKSLGRIDNNLRTISVRVVHPNLGKEYYSIVVDITKVRILTESEIKVVKCIYET